MARMFFHRAFLLLIVLMLAACNLSGGSESAEVTLTADSALTLLPSRTPQTTSSAPTPLPLGSLVATQQTVIPRPTNVPPTAIVILPTFPPPVSAPTNTPAPISILILSPVPGNVVAGNVQVLGAAIHPQFLQYQLEYGPENTVNLWYPATAAIQSPITNGILGIWNTTSVPDGTYNLRLRVYLRDGTTVATVINNIRVQNRTATPVPSNTPNIPRPIAAFTQDVTSGQVPLTVRFTNQSSGDITNFTWNFGDGSSSSERNPIKTFNSPGLFNVTLTVSGPGGASNVTRQINVQSPTAPESAFDASPISGFAPLTVQFNDTSTGQITTRLWNFSDGGASNERSPQHTFTTPGIYNVFLTVTGPGGSSTSTRQITVQSNVTNTQIPTVTLFPTATTEAIASPVAGFVANPLNGAVPLTVQFTDQSTGSITSRLWNFGDGGASNETNPQYTFTTPGVYNVILTVTGAGGSSTANQQISVQAPIAASPTSTEIPPTATFTETPTDIPTEIPTETPTDIPTETPTDIPTATPTETPTDIPTATPTETPTDIPTETPTDIPTATPTDVPTNTPIPAPVAAFDFRAQDGNPMAIEFFNQSTGEIGGVIWDFGDGQQSQEANPVHQYAAAGTYTVTLSVSGAGGTNFTQRQVTIEEPLVVAFTVQPAGAQTFQFVNQSTGAVSILWDFNDGTQSNERDPIHTYAQPGTYTVTLYANSASGVQQIAQQQVTVTAPLSVELFVNAVEGDPATIQFTAMASGEIAAYNWDFGDGQQSQEANPLHTYAVSGNYTVTLQVIAPDGSTAVSQKGVLVEIPPTIEPTVEIPVEPTLETPVEPTPETPTNPTLQDTEPVVPDIAALGNPLRNIFQTASPVGKVANSFTVVGDESASQNGLLTPFSNPNGYILGENSDLQAIIDFYSQPLPDGLTPFNRRSAAVGNGWRAADLLDPSLANPNLCSTQTGETPFGCELRVSGASVVFISVGQYDIANQTDPQQFRTNIDALVSTSINYGVIPVLVTIQPGQDLTLTNAYNEILFDVAEQYRIPVLNAWRAVNGLENVSPAGAGDLSQDSVSRYAVNALNAALLRTLNDLRTLVFPNA